MQIPAYTVTFTLRKIAGNNRIPVGEWGYSLYSWMTAHTSAGDFMHEGIKNGRRPVKPFVLCPPFGVLESGGMYHFGSNGFTIGLRTPAEYVASSTFEAFKEAMETGREIKIGKTFFLCTGVELKERMLPFALCQKKESGRETVLEVHPETPIALHLHSGRVKGKQLSPVNEQFRDSLIRSLKGRIEALAKFYHFECLNCKLEEAVLQVELVDELFKVVSVDIHMRRKGKVVNVEGSKVPLKMITCSNCAKCISTVMHVLGVGGRIAFGFGTVKTKLIHTGRS